MTKLNTTKKGNVKISINPERKYQGQFVGDKFFSLAVLKRVFPAVKNFAELDKDGFDLGDTADNEAMVLYHCTPFRRVGYVCE